MNKKYGLGRGLGALIPDDILNNSDTETIVKKINIDSISANEEQPRKNFDESKIVQLSQSIKEHGIIQPLILNRETENYIIVAGERRWRAARLAGLKEVPAIVMNLSDRDILEISLIENIQRQDLNPIEEAIAYKKLINDFKLKQEELANKIGKSRTAITNCMRLLNLDSRVQDYLINGLITEGHGRTLLTLEDKNSQYEFAKSIIKNDLTVRQVEKLVKDIKHNKKNIGNRQSTSNPYYVDIEEKLKELFGTKVILNDKKNKGKIEIEYYSPDDLQRILDILKV
ncbi:ParB/RepB/Spo0J family partition protein [Clostridium tyrobutyricum]|uniref:ParB/RepB/Spo0J family partition protein n=1 Tax=Clostridium tyrobutyricum TaxID=1519 RepID=UPI001C387B25|nr:ParB/RepB/Spo0J family partition protein [Clostridium tyrobutyricum]MBV4420026.1 ParB/RepB/Spo0J family partition protein [Clostridium tyrobutyricum]